MKKEINIVKGNQINAGNYIVSIGTYNIEDVAIISKITGNIVLLKDAGKKLKKIKQKWNIWLNSENTLTFQNMPSEFTKDLIKELRRK